mmetsp:Transcript_19863/g.32659  ORF Transcript_19863/g.32659 Transcript_19863/m.32659 type:complete len:353 (-) Transcript_19863:22-1080(-)|eukprot:CAMPEP_0203746344 /NCGR_PEP_ID=MMETSP0098-20131031/1821_1 /ASSEMBLY_ACC=CAM_ASM_000208 /TAXON_ID=96639 /ORGANISM=" , Strain NY0313808BC1" /LENGTH=352 /DNA_ID=CAMNT_0050634413 /DNA_START=672 /DNA_END=1727 /DNA_ORIENTATION=+
MSSDGKRKRRASRGGVIKGVLRFGKSFSSVFTSANLKRRDSAFLDENEKAVVINPPRKSYAAGDSNAEKKIIHELLRVPLGLREVLANEELKRNFILFCKSQLNCENLSLYMAVERFRAGDYGEKSIEGAARSLYDRYFKDDAVEWVCMSHRLSSELVVMLEMGIVHVNMFEKVQRVTVETLETDVIPRWSHSVLSRISIRGFKYTNIAQVRRELFDLLTRAKLENDEKKKVILQKKASMVGDKKKERITASAAETRTPNPQGAVAKLRVAFPITKESGLSAKEAGHVGRVKEKIRLGHRHLTEPARPRKAHLMIVSRNSDSLRSSGPRTVSKALFVKKNSSLIVPSYAHVE